MSAREFHYVLTLTWSIAANSSRTFTADGLFTPAPGTTRHDAYQFLIAELRKVKRIPDHASIVTNCFAFEPNELEASA